MKTPSSPATKVELLAPAGEPDAGYAALQYGADAIYLGLEKFSARAEATNFTPEQLSEIVGYAHSLTPKRKVYVTVNTVALDDELPEIAATFAMLMENGVDAVIVQDLGVARLAREHFPKLRLHASTQLAIHNLAGARAAKELGFSRATLARELTLGEIAHISAESGIEIETFVHGALCYSYSGLCLYSSLLRGRSGNRGKCTYACRDVFQIRSASDFEGLDNAAVFPFSMKDLALPDRVDQLREAGVTSFKIEGRKKSPPYVAAVVNYYRRLIDGNLVGGESEMLASDVKTIFSRPWTRGFIDSASNQTVSDPETVTHLGAIIGEVERVEQPNEVLGRPVRGQRREEEQPKEDARKFVVFQTKRDLECRDGLQAIIPRQGKPYGFSVDVILLLPGLRGKGKVVYSAPADSWVAVMLPHDAPELTKGMKLYHASSQVVKQKYTLAPLPRLEALRPRIPLKISLTLTATNMSAVAIVDPASPFTPAEAKAEIQLALEPAKDASKTAEAARKAFDKLGDTTFLLADFSVNNPDSLFAPISRMNDLRRDLVAAMNLAHEEARQKNIVAIRQRALVIPQRQQLQADGDEPFSWIVKTDRLASLAGFQAEDWQGLDEVIIDIANLDPAEANHELTNLSKNIDPSRIRLALPIIMRDRDNTDVLSMAGELVKSGWRKWEMANISGFSMLASLAKEAGADLDLSADWPLYTINRQAAQALFEAGVKHVTLSPEDGQRNLAKFLPALGALARVIVYQDTPLFISASCAKANLKRGCDGQKGCADFEAKLRSSHLDEIIVTCENCGTVAISERPLCLSASLDELRRIGARSLRVDFAWRKYDPTQAVELLRTIKRGESIPRTHEACFPRSL